MYSTPGALMLASERGWSMFSEPMLSALSPATFSASHPPSARRRGGLLVNPKLASLLGEGYAVAVRVIERVGDLLAMRTASSIENRPVSSTRSRSDAPSALGMTQYIWPPLRPSRTAGATPGDCKSRSAPDVQVAPRQISYALSHYRCASHHARPTTARHADAFSA
jgi:hypothetical protein